MYKKNRESRNPLLVRIKFDDGSDMSLDEIDNSDRISLAFGCEEGTLKELKEIQHAFLSSIFEKE